MSQDNQSIQDDEITSTTTPATTSSSETNHLAQYESHFDAEDIEETVPKRRKGRIYEKIHTSDSLTEAQEYIKNLEKDVCSWRFVNESKSGSTFYYTCTISSCPSKCYILCGDSTDIYRSNDKHLNHEKSKRGLDDKTKECIAKIYETGTTLPLQILYQLKQQHDISVSKTSLANYLVSYKKKKFGNSTIYLHEVEEFCEKYNHVPVSEDEVFVSNYSIDEIEASFIIFLTTKRLLGLVKFNSKHVCADATYKLVWQGYPVLIVGTINKEKKFHPYGLALTVNEETVDFEFIFRSIKDGAKNIFDNDFIPNSLVADASGAIMNGFSRVFGEPDKRIMCWAHMIRNVDKHANLVNDKKQWPKIRTDIEALQVAANSEMFTKGAQLFCDKCVAFPDFLSYFKTQWLDRNFGWYKGYATTIPSTNNALESFYRTIKQHHTFGKRAPVGQFFELVRTKMIVSWSLDRSPSNINAKLFSTVPDMTLEDYTKAYQWLQKKKSVKVKKSDFNESRINLNFIPSSTSEHFSRDSIDYFMHERTALHEIRIS